MSMTRSFSLVSWRPRSDGVCGGDMSNRTSPKCSRSSMRRAMRSRRCCRRRTVRLVPGVGGTSSVAGTDGDRGEASPSSRTGLSASDKGEGTYCSAGATAISASKADSSHASQLRNGSGAGGAVGAECAGEPGGVGLGVGRVGVAVGGLPMVGVGVRETSAGCGGSLVFRGGPPSWRAGDGMGENSGVMCGVSGGVEATRSSICMGNVSRSENRNQLCKRLTKV